MQHLTTFTQGYDCRRFECVSESPQCAPGLPGFHGQRGLTIRFVSKGPEGAVQFLLCTGWTPQYAERSSIGCLHIPTWNTGSLYPMILGYHSKKPQYEDHEVSDSSCMYCDGAPCYYGDSGLNASDAMYALVNAGDEGLWTFLDDYYKSIFHGAAYPAPSEFKTKPRRIE